MASAVLPNVEGPPVPRVRRLVAPFGVAMAALGTGLLLDVVDPNQSGHYPLCPFKALTGLDCPGCGSLRSIHDLTRGNVVAALDQNVLAVLAVPLLVVVWLRWARRGWRGEARPARLAPPWALWALLMLVGVFGVVRNLPGVPFLHSGIG